MNIHTQQKQAAQTTQFTEQQIKLAVKFKQTYWSGAWLRVPESKRIAALELACRSILRASAGDLTKAGELASVAVWS